MTKRIGGIALVRNEDIFVEQAVRNVLDFCDEIILADHRSRDGTRAILRRLAADYADRVELHEIQDPSTSHDLIANLAGESAWVLGVDGDELYDSERLRGFRSRLLAGEFDDWWLIRSNVLHVVELGDDRRWAFGYMSPPAPSVVKLHNFGLIERWDGCHPERLHGTDGLQFKSGRESRKLELQKVFGWNASPLRCLHVCFVRRSTRERRGRARVNIPDLNAPRRLPKRLWYRARVAAGIQQSAWKSNYRQGETVTVDATPFFR